MPVPSKAIRGRHAPGTWPPKPKQGNACVLRIVPPLYQPRLLDAIDHHVIVGGAISAHAARFVWDCPSCF